MSGVVWLCSINRNLEYTLVSYPTFTFDADKFSILSFDFFDDLEVAVLGQTQRKDKGQQVVRSLRVCLSFYTR